MGTVPLADPTWSALLPKGEGRSTNVGSQAAQTSWRTVQAEVAAVDDLFGNHSLAPLSMTWPSSPLLGTVRLWH
jgi:hypothetical protein